MKPERTNKITESPSIYHNLETMETMEIIEYINQEDQKVAEAVHDCLPTIREMIDAIFPKFSTGGRLFYIGAGTSGRLGVLDASEIPPTYGMPHNKVVGIIAGGDQAIRKSVEFAEDDPEQAKKDLEAYKLNADDAVIGVAASGSTPYVVGGLTYARQLGAFAGGITNNPNSAISEVADITIEIIVGPEFVTGSTRMKSGSSQKMVLNMLSTALMIKIGRVKGNKMVNMQLNNQKLVNRGVNFLVEELSITHDKALKLLNKHGSVNEAMLHKKGSLH
ncbi:N-acetylmuramic acid 6-phosphate etherase [Fulvivirga sp. M361]|uniref:N-acetylmuramic acid 6-phosphate etherase n=1 Tax=Fulvivirga sp. M361 TaxID=2594266 RepID=UPI00117B1972|nr:N-acetylmuramic acid 6-phosphate etherase [Fulvivirga sp. M361]TRX50935.1 N-acetylmuramic acid 6-phosphate etherase [Fulvivirga sp. M361]